MVLPLLKFVAALQNLFPMGSVALFMLQLCRGFDFRVLNSSGSCVNLYYTVYELSVRILQSC